MTKKKDVQPDEPVLGTGAAGDVENPGEGAPAEHEVFEPAPVDAPKKTEKEHTK